MSELAAQLVLDLPKGPAGLPGWIMDLRGGGEQQFRTHGLPTRKDEAWKYTGLSLLKSRETRISSTFAVDAAHTKPTAVAAAEYQINMLDGRMLEMSGEARTGVTILPLTQAMEANVSGLRSLLEALPASNTKKMSSDGFTALNTAMLENGVVIHVAAGVDAGRLLLNWSSQIEDTARLFNTRICLILEPSAKLEILEQFENSPENANTSNIVVQAEVGEGACLHHIRLQQESEAAGLITRTEVLQRAKSHYAYFGFDFGGGLVRHDLHSSLLGEDAKASLNGAYLLDNKRHVDNHARVDHIAKRGYSEQYFRGVAGGSSRAVFDTAVHVHPGADETEAKQSNANILLSKRAQIDTKPELEIYADEVIASHGATVGQLDESAVFYMRTRGLSEEQARRMLTMAFCRSVSDKLEDRELAEVISERMMDVMPQLD